MQFKSPLPKQTKNIYSLLLKGGILSAEKIGKELKIFPHAVYRSINQLKALGCVNQTGKHPAFYEAQSIDDSIETFTLLQREWFLNEFTKNAKNKNKSSKEQLNISFIESREMLFEKALSDIDNAKEEMENLASGDELPAEIMLAQKNALERGVNIRTLFQKKNKENESFIRARTKMGEQIRIYKNVNVRIVIFDRKIVYFMSYDPANYIKSTGIRFEYAPMGQLIHNLFEQYWEKGIESI